MAFAQIADTTLFYDYSQFGHPETLVFSNSLGTDHTMWEPQLDMLSHHFNILRYDTRGHGQSGITDGPYSIAQLGNDVLQLLDFLQLEKVHFCGLSMGGLIGQWLGIHAAQRLDHLIISNTAAKVGTEASWDTRIEQVTNQGLESIIPATAQRWFTEAFIATNSKAVANILDVFKRTSIQGYTANCAAVRDADFTEDLYKIEVPTLVISGLQDKVTTEAEGKFLAKRIAVASHIAINAAHLSSVELAEEFGKLILYHTQQH